MVGTVENLIFNNASIVSTLKALASVLHENNRQRIELFGLTQTKQILNDDLFSFDPVGAAWRGGLKI